MDPRDDHRSIETLFRIDRGELPLSAASEQELGHLHALCPECKRVVEEFGEVLREIELRRGELPLGRPSVPSPELQALLASDRREAEKEVEWILGLARKERKAKVTGAYKRFKTPAFVDRMIEEARTWVRHDPREALELLDLAEARLPKIPTEIYGEAMVRRAGFRLLAHQANCLRVAGDLRAAAARFERLNKLQLGEPAEDALLEAEMASLEASLRYDQRRLPEAKELLDRAADKYRREGDADGLARVQIQCGMILYIAGEAERAIPHFESAAAAVDPETSPQLAFNSLHNLVLCLCAVDQARVASGVLEEARAVYERLVDPTNGTLLTWAEGKVAAGLEDEGSAIRCFREARDAYRERALGYDEALVSLDLAAVYLRLGETAQVKQLAKQMAATFVERGVEIEAPRAVALFHEAAFAETLTFEIIARTEIALRRVAAALPAAQF